MPGLIATPGRLDFDYLRAHIGEHLAAHRTRYHLRVFNHAYVIECSFHGLCISAEQGTRQKASPSSTEPSSGTDDKAIRSRNANGGRLLGKRLRLIARVASG